MSCKVVLYGLRYGHLLRVRVVLLRVTHGERLVLVRHLRIRYLLVLHLLRSDGYWLTLWTKIHSRLLIHLLLLLIDICEHRRLLCLNTVKEINQVRRNLWLRLCRRWRRCGLVLCCSRLRWLL